MVKWFSFARLSCFAIFLIADSIDFSGSIMLYSPQNSGSEKPEASSLNIIEGFKLFLGLIIPGYFFPNL